MVAVLIAVSDNESDFRWRWGLKFRKHTDLNFVSPPPVVLSTNLVGLATDVFQKVNAERKEERTKRPALARRAGGILVRLFQENG